jgi:uncharacterized protein
MAYPLEQKIRDASAAFALGDVDGYVAACTEDFSFHVPGENSLSGVYSGRPGVFDLAGRAMALSAGTFTEEVEDVLATDTHAVVLARHRFTRDGALKDYRTAHVYDVRDGQLARCYEQPRDPAVFDDAWGPAQALSRPQSA